MSTVQQQASAPPDTHVYGPPVAVAVHVAVTALAFLEADGTYSVVIPELPGCYSAAESIEDVAGNAAEAAAGWIAVEHDRKRDEATAKIVDPLP